MRNHWILFWTLAGFSAGCAGPSGGYVAQGPKPASQYASQPSVSQKISGFTKKITSAFTGVIPTAPQPPVVQNRPDSISLDFESGPPNAQLFLSMAKMNDHGGNIPEARKLYQKTLAMEPQNLDALLGLARLEDRGGRLNEALQIYQRAVTIHPQSAKALNDLALCLARTGQLVPSLGLLQQATQLKPEKALYRNNIAKVLAQMNRSSEALSHLSAVHPPAVAEYNLGVLLKQLDRRAEALQHLNAAINIDPQMQPARTLLAQLGGGAYPPSGPAAGITTDDSILPTPMTPPANYATGIGRRQPYPNTGAHPHLPIPQAVPGISARVPVGNPPVLLPPVR